MQNLPLFLVTAYLWIYSLKSVSLKKSGFWAIRKFKILIRLLIKNLTKLLQMSRWDWNYHHPKYCILTPQARRSFSMYRLCNLANLLKSSALIKKDLAQPSKDTTKKLWHKLCAVVAYSIRLLYQAEARHSLPQQPCNPPNIQSNRVHRFWAALWPLNLSLLVSKPFWVLWQQTLGLPRYNYKNGNFLCRRLNLLLPYKISRKTRRFTVECKSSVLIKSSIKKMD